MCVAGESVIRKRVVQIREVLTITIFVMLFMVYLSLSVWYALQSFWVDSVHCFNPFPFSLSK